MIELSVVVPVYYGERSIETLFERLNSTLRTLDITYELVFVDDRSPDQTWERIKKIADCNKHVKGLRFSRNSGQHVAITAGLAYAEGNWIVVMDCDLEDPPEDIPRLYTEAKKGFDIVLARRKTRHHSLFRRVAAKLYFKFLSMLCHQNIDGDFGTFSIVSRKVVSAYLQVRDVDRHYLFVIRWLGFRSSIIDYEQNRRFDGESTYSVRALLVHAISGILFQSTHFLIWIICLGFVVSLTGLALAAVYVVRYFVNGAFPGWTSLAVLQLILSGFIITSTGVTALYVGRMFEQVKGRPLFVVDQTTFADPADNTADVCVRPVKWSRTDGD